jgi:hypothetical protein
MERGLCPSSFFFVESEVGDMEFINANYSKNMLGKTGYLTELTFVKEDSTGIIFTMDRYEDKYVKVYVNQKELHKFLGNEKNHGKLLIVGLVKDKRYAKYPVDLPHGTEDAFTISRVALVNTPVNILITDDSKAIIE